MATHDTVTFTDRGYRLATLPQEREAVVHTAWNQCFIVFGAGPAGRALARHLVSEGAARVTLASRSGGDHGLVGVRPLAVDATDADAVLRACDGADVVVNCLGAPYHRWPQELPPMADALLAAAEATGAVLAIASNLYAYGPVDGPMVEGLPDAAEEPKGLVRAEIWSRALDAHDAGRCRVVEVRASDFMGPGIGEGAHIPRLLPPARRGKSVRVLGDPDQPHTWTDVRDLARTITAAAVTPTAHGRVWHAASNPPRTQRQALGDVLAEGGPPMVGVKAVPQTLVRAMALVSPMMGELDLIWHQFDRPFVMDSTAAERELGVAPTPWPEVCRRTLAG